MKKNILFNIKHETAEGFRNHVWNNYKEYNLCRIFNYSSYFSRVIESLYDLKQKNYSKWIHSLDDQQLKFLKKPKIKNAISNTYHSYNDSITVRIEEKLIDKLYVLAYNCYMNEYSDFQAFSISIFFEVIFDDIKNLHYSKHELEKN